MMKKSKILELREKAKNFKKKIVLPEGDDKRVLRAGVFLATQGIAEITILGNNEKIKNIADENNIELKDVTIVNPVKHLKFKELADAYYNLRKYKGMTQEEAEKILKEMPVFFGAMMVNAGLMDGFVAGASTTTANVARGAIQCLKIDKAVGTISSAFIMEVENSNYGENGLFIFADCGIIPLPSVRQLAGIAISSSDLFYKLFGVKARTALLSYSTKGSAESETINIIRGALEEVKQKRPDIMVDGELQLDAAIVPEVAKIKCPESVIAGKANVLIFPNLEAGNIGYKIVQRLANARAVGPIMLGLEKPCSDLSRGCDWEDIVDAVTITSLRA
ncbi:phosphotransacetylase [Candidatus Omnitrophus magneticus]|uniref:Phosphate acetyltransferase n=1 Tax=Candidatus Omnitrophus magneticus TaxID=1609969 RepID=A0A0F0CQM1_9BACT|nr:phosphotransacetylase [Candidatus Omnitrophus magneticus]